VVDDKHGSRVVKREGTIQIALMSAAAVVLLLSIVLFREFRSGILVGPLPWDDCAIVAQAFDRLTVISSSTSLLDAALHARYLAPHSPVADIQAILGLLVSGGAVWGPYVLNGVAALAVALTVGLVANARRGAVTAVTLLVILLLQPLMLFSFMALKADWKSGLFFATAIYLLFEAAVTRRRTLWTAGAAFLALAMLCKLTAFYMPVPVIGILILFWLCELKARRPEATSLVRFSKVAAAEAWGGRRELLRLMTICLLPFALFFLWGSVSYYNLLIYIREALSPRWNDGLDHLQRIAFYGPWRNPVWGVLGLEAPLLLAVAAMRGWRRDKLALHILCAIVFVAILFFGLLIAPDNANIEFSGSFVGIVLGLTLVAAASLSDSRWLARGVLALCVGFAAFSPLTGFDVVLTPKEPPVSTEDRHAAMGSLRAMVSDIARLSGAHPTHLNFMFEDSIAGFPNAAIEFTRQTGGRLSTGRIDELPIRPNQQSSADTSVFIVIMKPTGAASAAGYRPQRRMPATADLEATARYVSALSDFQKVGEYPWKNARLQLFMRPAAAQLSVGSLQPHGAAGLMQAPPGAMGAQDPPPANAIAKTFQPSS
jgi:hypothetical protein